MTPDLAKVSDVYHKIQTNKILPLIHQKIQIMKMIATLKPQQYINIREQDDQIIILINLKRPLDICLYKQTISLYLGRSKN